jgi:hypothetical protein
VMCASISDVLVMISPIGIENAKDFY